MKKKTHKVWSKNKLSFFNLRKINFLIILSVIFFNANIFSETSDLFKFFCMKLSENKIIRGDFTLAQKSAKTGKAINSSGTYTLSQNDGIIWFTEKPVKSVMVMMDDRIVQEIRGQKKVMDGKQNETFKGIADVISAIFTGRYDEINSKFEINCKENKNEKNFEIELIPSDKTIAVYLKKVVIKAQIAGNSAEINEFTIIQFNDDEKKYVLSGQTGINSLSESEKHYFEK